MRAVELLRFGLEVALVVAAAVVGSGAGPLGAVGAVVVVVAVWGRFVAPKSAHRLDDPARLGCELVLFLAVGGGLAARGATAAGAILALASTVVAIAVRRARSSPPAPPDR